MLKVAQRINDITNICMCYVFSQVWCICWVWWIGMDLKVLFLVLDNGYVSGCIFHSFTAINVTQSNNNVISDIFVLKYTLSINYVVICSKHVGFIHHTKQCNPLNYKVTDMPSLNIAWWNVWVPVTQGPAPQCHWNRTLQSGLSPEIFCAQNFNAPLCVNSCLVAIFQK